MLAFQIVRHAVLMVSRNLVDILRLSGPIFASGLLMILLIAAMLGAATQDGASFFTGPKPLLLGLGSFAMLAATLWSYVAWHRFILLEERPESFWMPVPVSNVLAYLGNLLLIALFGLLLSVPVLFVLSGVLAGGSVLGYVLLGLVYLAVLTVVTRLSILLPAAAIGSSLSVGKLWADTAGSFGTILVCVLLFGLFSLGLTSVFSILGTLPYLGVVFAILGGAVNFFVGFCGLSLLTTLYGHYIEKRELM